MSLQHIQRDLILFVAGLGGVLHETLRVGPERPTLLLLFAGMLGLPLFLNIDERRAKLEERALQAGATAAKAEKAAKKQARKAAGAAGAGTEADQ